MAKRFCGILIFWRETGLGRAGRSAKSRSASEGHLIFGRVWPSLRRWGPEPTSSVCLGRIPVRLATWTPTRGSGLDMLLLAPGSSEKWRKSTKSHDFRSEKLKNYRCRRMRTLFQYRIPHI